MRKEQVPIKETEKIIHLGGKPTVAVFSGGELTKTWPASQQEITRISSKQTLNPISENSSK